MNISNIVSYGGASFDTYKKSIVAIKKLSADNGGYSQANNESLGKSGHQRFSLVAGNNKKFVMEFIPQKTGVADVDLIVIKGWSVCPRCVRDVIDVFKHMIL